MTLFLGVDGGGTSCRALVCDEQGRHLGHGKAGSANIMLGANKAMQAVLDATRAALEAAGLGNEAMSHLHAGLALAGVEHQGFAEQFLAIEHPFAKQTLATDAMGALLGAFAGEDGAIMIFGTGSAGVVKQGDRISTVGGHEFPISDIGGGATLGLEVIRASLLSFEQILPPSALANWVMQRFDNQIDSLVSWSKSAIPSDYGSFAKPCFEFAEQGDPLATQLLDRHIKDCHLMLDALVAKGAQRMALMGSIGERLQPLLQAHYPTLVKPKFNAECGALLLAGLPADKLQPVAS